MRMSSYFDLTYQFAVQRLEAHRAGDLLDHGQIGLLARSANRRQQNESEQTFHFRAPTRLPPLKTAWMERVLRMFCRGSAFSTIMSAHLPVSSVPRSLA